MPDNPKHSEQPTPLSVWFRLVIIACCFFVVTILALIATLFNTTVSPVTVFLNDYSSILLIVEVIFIILLSIVALKFDRSPILRNLEQFESRYDQSGDDVDEQERKEETS